MTPMGWMAVVLAGIAVWMWLPPDPVARLAPPRAIRLPVWAQPLPSAMDSRKRWWIGLAAGFAVVAYGWSMTWMVVFLGPGVCCATWVGLGKLELAGARRARLAAQAIAPQALELLQGCVHAGQPLRNAVEIVTEVMPMPVSALLARVRNAVSVGMVDADAWLVLKDDPILGSVAADLGRSAAWGTSVTDVLGAHAEALRRKAKTARLAAAKAVGVRSVLPLGMCYLPAFMLLGVVPMVAAGMSLVLG